MQLLQVGDANRLMSLGVELPKRDIRGPAPRGTYEGNPKYSKQNFMKNKSEFGIELNFIIIFSTVYKLRCQKKKKY